MGRGVATAIGAAAIFLGSFFVLEIGIFGSVMLATVFFVGSAGVAARRSIKARRAERVGTSSSAGNTGSARRGAMKIDLTGLDISEEDFNAALSGGATKLAALKRASEKITDGRVRGKAYAVCDSVARILSDIREDPKDLRPARKFLDYYLDATITVVDRYATLSAKSVASDELSASLARVEDSLDTIKQAYDKQRAQLLENDVMALDTELEVLERTIRMEGLGSE